MDAALFERLLNEEEGATLDFKKEQYPFAKATDDEKSELLKDILAFANAGRRADAYILIGVEEVRGGRSKVIGVTAHLDDHSLQQFVTHKTSRTPHFSYEAFTFDGKQIGIITIRDHQARPIYLKADYGKLKKKVVYVRYGSSTCEADVDDIARMGTSDAPVQAALQGIRLEIWLNREVVESILGDLENLLRGNGLIPLRRLNERATASFIERPLVSFDDPTINLSWVYLQGVRVLNRLVDSIDNPLVPDDFKRNRICQALDFRERIKKSDSELLAAVEAKLNPQG